MMSLWRRPCLLLITPASKRRRHQCWDYWPLLVSQFMAVGGQQRPINLRPWKKNGSLLGNWQFNFDPIGSTDVDCKTRPTETPPNVYSICNQKFSELGKDCWLKTVYLIDFCLFTQFALFGYLILILFSFCFRYSQTNHQWRWGNTVGDLIRYRRQTNRIQRFWAIDLLTWTQQVEVVRKKSITAN
jgi:hypothetical protein